MYDLNYVMITKFWKIAIWSLIIIIELLLTINSVTTIERDNKIIV